MPTPEHLREHFALEAEREARAGRLQAEVLRRQGRLAFKWSMLSGANVDATPPSNLVPAEGATIQMGVFGTADGVGTREVGPQTSSGKAEGVALTVVTRKLQLPNGTDAGSLRIDRIREDMFQVDPSKHSNDPQRVELDDLVREMPFSGADFDKMMRNPDPLNDEVQEGLVDELQAEVDDLGSALATLESFPHPLHIVTLDVPLGELNLSGYGGYDNINLVNDAFDSRVRQSLAGLSIIGAAPVV